jgi:hypothetical protein
MDDKFHLTALTVALAIALVLTAPAGAAETTTGQSKVIGKTTDTFAPFAGSRSNAENLAIGLRTGSEITLTGSATNEQATTFTPPTRPMGHGNVNKALALSSQQLAAAGVAQPSPAQIKTSLMGGTITNDAGQRVDMQGVLQMRADGMGWGKIAHELGVKPGQGYRPAHTASGVTTASSTAGVVSAKGKQTGSTSAGTGKPSKAIAGSQPSRSGIVTATGASVQGSAHASSKGSSHRANSLTTAGGKSGSVTQSGVVSAAGGSVSSGHGGGGGLAKGHAK